VRTVSKILPIVLPGFATPADSNCVASRANDVAETQTGPRVCRTQGFVIQSSTVPGAAFALILTYIGMNSTPTEQPRLNQAPAPNRRPKAEFKQAGPPSRVIW